MRVFETKLMDAKLIETDVHIDHRGFFTEIYTKNNFNKYGFFFDFIQDNHSFSKEPGVIRGLHFQTPDKAQTKLVRVTSGVIYDVLVDIRKGSPTYGQWEGYILSEFNQRQLLIPKGFAHGYVTLTSNCNVHYKVDNPYSVEHDGGITFNDSIIAIEWPINIDKAILSDKDKNLPTLSELDSPFIWKGDNK